MTLALQIEEVSRRFGGVTALDSVSMTVEEGEIRGVIGPNGAGKTTLLNVLSGVYPPSAGRLRCFGHDVGGLPPYRITERAGLVRTFQSVRLFPTMTVWENVMVAAGAPRKRGNGADRGGNTAKERAELALQQLAIVPMKDSRVTELSYGSRRRVELARALSMQPRLLLLDEPAAGLNGAERSELAAILRAVRDQGITVVLIEHQMDLVMAVSDHLTVLDFGKVIGDGAPRDVIEDAEVLRAYFGTADRRVLRS